MYACNMPCMVGNFLVLQFKNTWPAIQWMVHTILIFML